MNARIAALAASALLAACCCLPPACKAEEPEIDPSQLPRLPAVEPAQAPSTFELHPGFKLELVAAEPLVVDPVAVCFDDDANMYVVEMRDYSERRPERLGRVRKLEDTDGDGRYDRASIFAEGFPWPTGIAWYNGGLYVASTPDILYLKDTDGDGKADRTEVVFTGFASDYAPYATNKLNVQAMLNNFCWGLDQRIHGATSFNGGKVSTPAHTNLPPLELRGRDFSFDPRTGPLRPETGGGQHGMLLDDVGRKFFCSNSDHAQLVMIDMRYQGRNPWYSLPTPKLSIAEDGPAAEVYRISPEEPWRVIRTRWRVAGVSSGLIEGGGRASGYFTSATGLTVYRGDALPPEYVGDIFVADCGSNLVHHKRPRKDGTSLIAARLPDEARTEFLRSKDTWFRPVQLANSPDGSLLVLDMYREIIEHPWSLPPTLKKHLNLNSGNDRGRIYRIVPDGFKQPKLPKLSKATTPELVATLEHRNGWHRETASRLIHERQDPAAVPLLQELLAHSKAPLARLHSLYCLQSLGALKTDHILAALGDADPSIRIHALRLAEPADPKSLLDGPLAERAASLQSDPDITVRYQLAWTLGQLPPARRNPAWATIAARDHADYWMRAALLNSAADQALPLLQAFVVREDCFNTATGQELAQGLVRMVCRRHQPSEVQALVAHIAAQADSARRLRLASAFAQGLSDSSGTLATADPQHLLHACDGDATQVLASADAQAGIVAAAASWAAFSADPGAIAALVAAVGGKLPPEPQALAVAALGRLKATDWIDAVCSRWTNLTPRVREEVARVILQRPDRVPKLAAAIDRGDLAPDDLGPSTRATLRRSEDTALRELAMKWFGSGTNEQRQALVERFRPALLLTNNPAHGREIFLQRCVSCHQLEGQGFAVGPDLVTVRSNGKEKLLIAMLDPNREVAPNFTNYQIETRDGETYDGIVVNETSSAVTLRAAYAKDTVVPRLNIARLRSLGTSIMPEELENGLSHQDVADLLEYLVTAGLGH